MERQCIINQSKFQQSLRDYYTQFPVRNTIKPLNIVLCYSGIMFRGFSDYLSNEIWYDVYIDGKWQGSVTPRNIRRYYPIHVSTISLENME